MAPPYTGNLVLSLDAALGVFKDTGKTTAATLANDVVALWADQSGLGSDVSQATAGNRPTFQPSIVNGLPVIRFAGSPVQYLNNTSTVITQCQNETIFIVYQTSNRNVQDVVYTQGTGTAFQFYQNNGGFWALYDGTAHTNNSGGQIGTLRNFQLCSIQVVAGAASIRLNRYISGVLGGTTLSQSTTGVGIGASTAAALPLFGDIAEILVYNEAVSGSNVTAIENYLAAKYAIPLAPSPIAPATTYPSNVPLVVVDGDSISAGTNMSYNFQEFVDLTYTTVSKIIPYNYANFAVPASGMTALNNRASVIDALYNAARGPGKNILQIFIGTNDIFVATSGTTEYAALQTYCLARKAVGWTVILCTCLPRQFNTLSAREPERIIYNNLIRGNAGGAADFVCDFAADQNWGVSPQDGNTVLYNADRVHPAIATQAMMSVYNTAIMMKALSPRGPRRIGFTGGMTG